MGGVTKQNRWRDPLLTQCYELETWKWLRLPSSRWHLSFKNVHGEIYIYIPHLALLTLVWLPASSSPENMQIDNTFFALPGLCQSWWGGQFLPVTLSPSWPSGPFAELIVPSWVSFALYPNRTKEYLPSPTFKGFNFSLWICGSANHIFLDSAPQLV